MKINQNVLTVEKFYYNLQMRIQTMISKPKLTYDEKIKAVFGWTLIIEIIIIIYLFLT